MTRRAPQVQATQTERALPLDRTEAGAHDSLFDGAGGAGRCDLQLEYAGLGIESRRGTSAAHLTYPVVALGWNKRLFL